MLTPSRCPSGRTCTTKGLGLPCNDTLDVEITRPGELDARLGIASNPKLRIRIRIVRNDVGREAPGQVRRIPIKER